MTTSEKDGLVLPLLIQDGHGTLVAALVTNEKGYYKSLERGQLWYLDGITGRLIPYEPIDSYTSLEIQSGGSHGSRASNSSHGSQVPNTTEISDPSNNSIDGFQKGAWILARVPTQDPGDRNNREPEKSSRPKKAESQDSGSATLGFSQASQIHGVSGALDKLSDPSLRTKDETKDPQRDQVLFQLEQLIRSRKQTMPEGSYTTHLFSKGEEKIRKKAGEEAIELLLAKTDQELVSESADFLYHLLVLLVEKSIPFQQVIDELASRK